MDHSNIKRLLLSGIYIVIITFVYDIIKYYYTVRIHDELSEDLAVQHIIWTSEREVVIIATRPDTYFYMLEFSFDISGDGKNYLEKK